MSRTEVSRTEVEQNRGEQNRGEQNRGGAEQEKEFTCNEYLHFFNL